MVKKSQKGQISKDRSVSFFKLNYSYAKKKDALVIILGIIGSLASGVVSIPLMAITFGGIVNNFNIKSSDSNENYYDSVKKMCLQYFYIGLGCFFSGFLMIWMWSIFGRRISKRIKKDYFRILMRQEQGFFEENDDILKYPTKIQAQMKKIEMGVIFIIIIITS
jgi:ATP-binding cassette subfamily B (MDR/TAP) protein 1